MMSVLLEEELRTQQQPRRAAASAVGAVSRTSTATPFPTLWAAAVARARVRLLREANASAAATPLPVGKRRARSTLVDDHHDRVNAAAELLSVLTLSELARAADATTSVVAGRSDALASMLMRSFSCWTAGYVRSAAFSLKRLRRFSAHAERVDGLTLASFLQSVDAGARAKARAAHTRSQATAQPTPEVEGFERFSAGGTTAVHSVFAGLRWLHTNAGVDVAVDSPLVRRFKTTKAHLAGASPSPCLSVRAVAALDAHSSKADASAFVRGHCAAWTMLHYTASRLAQLQRSSQLHNLDSMRTMVTARDKSPVLGGGRPKAFWAPREGIAGVGYLDAVDTMLADLHEPSFVLRDTDSPDGDPSKATCWKDEACVGSRASQSLRACLVLAAGMEPAEAKWYSPSSARHFLPLIAMIRNESADRSVELGRWAGSAAANDGVLASERARAKAAASASRMPARYAGAAVPAMVMSIIDSQIKACARLVESRGRDSLPLHGGFELLGPLGGASASPPDQTPPTPAVE